MLSPHLQLIAGAFNPDLLLDDPDPPASILLLGQLAIGALGLHPLGQLTPNRERVQAPTLLPALVCQSLQPDDERECAVAACQKVLHCHRTQIYDVRGARCLAATKLDLELRVDWKFGWN